MKLIKVVHPADTNPLTEKKNKPDESQCVKQRTQLIINSDKPGLDVPADKNGDCTCKKYLRAISRRMASGTSSSLNKWSKSIVISQDNIRSKNKKKS